ASRWRPRGASSRRTSRTPGARRTPATAPSGWWTPRRPSPKAWATQTRADAPRRRCGSSSRATGARPSRGGASSPRGPRAPRGACTRPSWWARRACSTCCCACTTPASPRRCCLLPHEDEESLPGGAYVEGGEDLDEAPAAARGLVEHRVHVGQVRLEGARELHLPRHVLQGHDDGSPGDWKLLSPR